MTWYDYNRTRTRRQRVFLCLYWRLIRHWYIRRDVRENGSWKQRQAEAEEDLSERLREGQMFMASVEVDVLRARGKKLN
jgi:hypothetical protein